MTISIDRRYCKGCGLCIYTCPKKVMELSGERSNLGYIMPKVVNPDDCTGCFMCEKICPDLCIDVEK